MKLLSALTGFLFSLPLKLHSVKFQIRLPLPCLLTGNINLKAKLLVVFFLFSSFSSFSQSNTTAVGVSSDRQLKTNSEAVSSLNDRQPKSVADTLQSAINWTTGLSWQQIKGKAKKENKYIFVDCYATWCKPCKEMDVRVYNVDSVGEFLNKEFISVKVQMDQTKNDDAFIKSWYKTARSFEKEYNLNIYPTMLFFTPSGEVATKEVGYKDASSFIKAARNSKDPSKQYFVLLKNYKRGKLNEEAKRSLINTAKQLGDTSNYQALRSSYFTYLHSLPKGQLYTKDNIEFISSIISRRSHVVFDIFYPDGSAVDKVMGKNGYARKVVDEVIRKEKIAPIANVAMDKKSEPDWDDLYNSIAKDYNNDYAERNVLDAKIQWYGNVQHDVLKFARSVNDKIEKYGSDTASLAEDFKLNNLAWIIFENIKDVIEVKRTIGWMTGVVRRSEKATGFYIVYANMYMDTYANLLHKVGRTTEAIKWEEVAIAKKKALGDKAKNLEETLELMKQGKPTWPEGTK